MESVARLSPAERRELFAETAARKGMGFNHVHRARTTLFIIFNYFSVR